MRRLLLAAALSLAPVLASATVAVDVVTENIRTLGTDPQTWSHAGAGSGVDGFLLLCNIMPSATDLITAASYGGVALTRIVRATDTADEPGDAEIWFLGSGVPQGTQTVSYANGGGGEDIHCASITLTAAGDTEVIDFDSVSENASNPSVTLQYSGRTAMAFAALFSGGADETTFTPNANTTSLHQEQHAVGARFNEILRQTTAGSSDFAIGGTAASEDVAFAAVAISEAAVVPAFDSAPSCASLDFDTMRCPADADANTDTIHYCVKAKDASAPANGAAVDTCSGGLAGGNVAATGSSQNIDIELGSDPFPIADYYFAGDDGAATYSTVASQLDETVPAPSGRQYVVKSGSPAVGQLGLLDGASPAAADTDYIDAPTHADSFERGPAANAITVNADTTFEINTEPTGLFPNPDASQQKFTRRFYAISAAGWSDAAPVLYCVNNVAAIYIGPDLAGDDIPFLFAEDQTVSLFMDTFWSHPFNEDMTHNVVNLPAGGSEDGEEISGAFTTQGFYTTVELEVTDGCTDMSEETVTFTVGLILPDIFSWLQDESNWKNESIFAANDDTFHGFQRAVGQ